MVRWIVGIAATLIVAVGGGVWASNSFMIAAELPDGSLGVERQMEQLPPEFAYARDNEATIRWQYVRRHVSGYDNMDRFEALLPYGTKVWVEAGDGYADVYKRVVGRIVSTNKDKGKAVDVRIAEMPSARVYIFGRQKGNVVLISRHKEVSLEDQEEFVIVGEVYAPEIKALFNTVRTRIAPGKMSNSWAMK